MRAHTIGDTHALGDTHTHTHLGTRALSGTRSHAHAHTHSRGHTRTLGDTHSRGHTRTRGHVHSRGHTHAHTHFGDTHTCTRTHALSGHTHSRGHAHMRAESLLGRIFNSQADAAWCSVPRPDLASALEQLQTSHWRLCGSGPRPGCPLGVGVFPTVPAQRLWPEGNCACPFAE